MIIFLIFVKFSFGQFTGPAKKAEGWKFLAQFSDEFENNELDSLKWQTNISSWGAWVWNKKNVYLKNGKLYIRINYSPQNKKGKKFFYDSGIIRSRNTIKYGYFEVSLKAPDRFPGICPAFWLSNHGKEKWTEIDIIELMQSRNSMKTVHLNTHVFKHPRLLFPINSIHEHFKWEVNWDVRKAFHSYACEWRPDSIKWFIDGEMVRKRENIYWDQPLYINLSIGLRPPLTTTPDSAKFPAEMQVEYIRIWELKGTKNKSDF